MRGTRLSFSLGSSLIGLMLSGCPSETPKSPVDASAAQPAAPRDIAIAIRGMAFDPPQAEVTAGSTVTWTNEDIVDHSATASDKTFDSGHITSHNSWKYTASKPGTFPYTCTLHPTMKGTLIVK